MRVQLIFKTKTDCFDVIFFFHFSFSMFIFLMYDLFKSKNLTKYDQHKHTDNKNMNLIQYPDRLPEYSTSGTAWPANIKQ